MCASLTSLSIRVYLQIKCVYLSPQRSEAYDKQSLFRAFRAVSMQRERPVAVSQWLEDVLTARKGASSFALRPRRRWYEQKGACQ